MKPFNLTEWALNHRAIVLFLILAIGIGGVLGFTKLGQLEDPKFSVPSMTALVIWPGATAQQIQDELLNRMEKKFEQLDHFDKVVTYARQGYGGMTITVKGGTSKEDQREAWYQARKKFTDIKLELPDGVIGPIFNDEYGDVTGLLYAVKGDGVSLAELSDMSEDIKRRLLKVPMVKKVDVIGKQAKKVYVEFSNERLAALGITPLMIAESLKNQNSVLAAGQIDTQSDRVMVRVTGQFASLDDIRNVPITAGGRTIKLGDFTTITRGYEDPPTYTVRHNGQQVLMLGIVMTDDGNIVDLGKAIDNAVGHLQAELPYGVELERVADQPTVVHESVWEFERSLLEALGIVLAVCLVSLGWRTGIVVGLSVPIVLGVVALVMLAMGWNLERVSLGSLIIALGLLVHDGIIAVEMMVVKMEEGWDRVKAAAFSYASTAMPRLTGALITTAAFMPVGFSNSTTGEYAGGIFWIVGTAVVFSWIVSGMITPDLAVKMLPEFAKQATPSAATHIRRRFIANCAPGSTSRWRGAGGSSAPPRRHSLWPCSEAGSCRSSFSRTATGPSSSSSCDSRKVLCSRRRPSRSRRWRRCSRRTRTSSSSPPTPAPANPAFISRSIRSCPTRATPRSSS